MKKFSVFVLSLCVLFALACSAVWADSYDPRAELPPIRNQDFNGTHYGTCWAHAPLGAMECSYLRQGLTSLGDEPNLSELHLAWFIYSNPEQGKAFGVPYPSEGVPYNVRHRGGRGELVEAFMARLASPTLEEELPYSKIGVVEAETKDKKPENYPLALRLRETYRLGEVTESNRDIVKQMIKKHGAVQVSFYLNSRASTSTYFFRTDNGSNHDVLLVGWDDDKNNFGTQGAYPTNKGAWLVRNSYGPSWGENGYFWISYEQRLYDAMVFIAEDVIPNLIYYGYDDLGYTGEDKHPWAANIFQVHGNETLKEIGLYSTQQEENGAQYELFVYDLGENRISSPAGGTLLTSQSGTLRFKGYHTIELLKPVSIKSGHYFSIVVNMITNNSWPTAIEVLSEWGTGALMAAPCVEAGESYFSEDGISWTDGVTHDTPRNACIKAFTYPSLGVPLTAFSDENFRKFISQNVDASPHDDVLSAAEIAAVTSLNVAGQGIADLKGIECFTSLQRLDCSNNTLSALDLSSNRELNFLDCSNNRLTKLDISGCTKLAALRCQNNRLATLDVSHCAFSQDGANLILGGQTLYDLEVTKANNSSTYSYVCEITKYVPKENISNIIIGSNGVMNGVRKGVWGYKANGDVLPAPTIIMDVDEPPSFLSFGFSEKPTKVSYTYRADPNLSKSNDAFLMSVMIENGSTPVVPGQPEIPVISDVPINEDYFPDATFRSYVSENFDKNKDGMLSAEEITQIKEIDVYKMVISSLKGIEYFTALERLDCSQYSSSKSQLTELDISKNMALKSLNCSNNKLTKLDVSKNTALEVLICSGNNFLATLDVSKNTALTALGCGINSLKTLDVSKNTALTSLNCSRNELTELDVSKNTALKSLDCSNNLIKTLDVSNNTALTSLVCGTNALTTLNVSKNTNLTSLRCGHNSLDTLDVSNNTALRELNCTSDRLTELDLSKNTALEILECNYNKLMTLDLRKNTAMKDLYCYNNRLMTLDVSGCTTLRTLRCENNSFMALDVSKSTALLDSNVQCYSQNVNIPVWQLVSLTDGTYPYQFDLKTYIPASQIGNVVAGSVKGYTGSESITTAYEDGVVRFSSKPTKVCYTYTVVAYHGMWGYSQKAMDVTVNFLDGYVWPVPTPLLTKPTITTSSLSSGIAGKSYNATLTASGSTPITWRATGLSDGITCSEAGVISGTPTISGTFTVSVTATNEAGSNEKVFTLVIENNGGGDTPTGLSIEGSSVFPDSTLRSYLSSTFDTDRDGTLSAEEIAAITEMNISGMDISSLEGIENFTDLAKLDCSNNSLTTLDVSDLRKLTYLDCSGNKLKKLDVRGCPKLEYLDCSNNELTVLILNVDYATSERLTNRHRSSNVLTTSSTSGCVNLKYLDCSNNKLGSLNVSGCSKLEYLDCSTNVLPALDVSDCVKLELLDCMDNELVELDISQCPKLETLDCSNNEITSLDVRDCPDLTSLNCDESTEVLRTEEEETPGADPNQEPEPEDLSILTSILPNGTVSTDYEVTILTASVSGVTWNVDGLPNGLIHRDGIISGIPEESGTFTVTVKATKGEQSKTKTIELVISAKGPSMPEPDPEEEPAPTPTPDGGTGGSGSSGGGTGGGNSGNGDGSGTPDQEDNASPDETTLPPEAMDSNIIEIVRKFLEEHGIAAQVFTFSDENAVLDSDRDVSSLEAGEREAIQNDNAVIAAILPEINVKKAGVYLFSTVLGADVPVGAILIWYPFPQSQGNVALADEDEGYCVFFDEEGSEITTVPENHHINVAAYFATGVTYAPVIGAVANSAADGGKDAGPIPDTSGKSTSDSGGGCDMGLGLFALVLLPLLAVGRRRK